MNPLKFTVILYLFILGIGYGFFGQDGLFISGCIIASHLLVAFMAMVHIGRKVEKEAKERGVSKTVILEEHREKWRKKVEERRAKVNKKLNEIDYNKHMDDDHFDEDALVAEVNRQLAQIPAIVGSPHVTGYSKKTIGTFNGFKIFEYIVFNDTHLFEFNGTTPVENGLPKMMVNEDEIVLESGIVYKFKEMMKK